MGPQTPLGNIFNQDLSGPLVTDALGEIQSLTEEAEGSEEAVSVVVVSSSLQGADDLAAATRDGVLTVLYDAASEDLDGILFAIEGALEGRSASSIAFATHETGPGSFHLFGDISVDPSTLPEDMEMQHFWQDVGALLTEDGRIDLMACDTASTQAGLFLISQLEELTGHEVAASDDPTGNAEYGGDWILETGNVDLVSTYFAWEKLQIIEGTLQSQSQIITVSGSDDFGRSVDMDGNYAIVAHQTNHRHTYMSGTAPIGLWTRH